MTTPAAPELGVPARHEVPADQTWDLASVFPSVDAWEAACREVEARLPVLQTFRGRLGEGPASLAAWIEVLEAAARLAGQVVVYANMGFAVDKTDQAAAGRLDRARGLMARVQAAAAFAEPELLEVGVDRLREWTREEPRLARYAHYVERLARRAPHVRTADVEEVLGLVTDPFRTASATHGILADADLVFPPARTTAGGILELTQGTYRALVSHPDREVRRTAWEGYLDAHLAHRHSMANAFAAGVKQAVFTARVRRYASSLEASLHANEIPVAVFHTLLAIFRHHLPTWHRYWRLRRRALGLERLCVYDERAPLGPQPRVPFPQAVEWIAAGMAPLGDEYVAVLRRGLETQRWVDRAINRGKQSGAFSTGAPGTHPFILMSYTDDLVSLSTLAHELGHSMHSYYTWKSQPMTYARYPLFLAEVASNFNQVLVRAHLLATQADRDMRIAVIEEAMSNFHRYFFVMPTLARFELEVHRMVERGEGLAADRLTALLADLFREGYGDEVDLDADRVGILWATFHTHLYSPFYVYQYATGLAAAHALGRAVLDGRAGAAARYLAFLAAGASDFPLDLLRRAGVDMTAPDAVEETFGVLAGYVHELGRLLEGRAAAGHAGTGHAAAASSP